MLSPLEGGLLLDIQLDRTARIPYRDIVFPSRDFETLAQPRYAIRYSNLET